MLSSENLSYFLKTDFYSASFKSWTLGLGVYAQIPFFLGFMYMKYVNSVLSLAEVFLA